MLLKFLLVLSVSLSAVALVGAESPIVAIGQGQIKGSTETSRSGKTFYQFLGIPYGKVPARFQNSVAADGWKGVRDGTKFGEACIQADTVFLAGKVYGSENCLFLNVYTPKLTVSGEDDKPLPVMVWIYGGGFTEGADHLYPGNYLTDQDVIVVTINYRLGIFGFLNAGVPGASGNQALKDQVLSLKWVQQNIESFGGDPNRTIIWGQSAGGASVNLLLLSPMAEGLFQGAISMSGAATCPWAAKNEPSLKQAQKLAATLDCPTSNANYMVECLKRLDANYILDKSKLIYEFGWEWDENAQFGPTIETVHEGDDKSKVFLSDDPYELAVDGKFIKVPYIMGSVSREGHLISAAQILKNENATRRLNEEWGRLAPLVFIYRDTALDPCKVSGKVKNFYFKDEPISNANGDQLTNAFSDRLFSHCVRETAFAMAKHTDLYLYHFQRKGKNSLTDLLKLTTPNEDKLPVHVDELQYLLNLPKFYPEIKAGDPRVKFSDSFAKLFASFAKNGKPTELWGSAKEWSPLQPDSKNPQWLVIDDDAKFEEIDKDFAKRMDFWKNLPLNEHGKCPEEMTS